MDGLTRDHLPGNPLDRIDDLERRLAELERFALVGATGAGSNLDADMLDGYHAGSAANTVLLLDASGNAILTVGDIRTPGGIYAGATNTAPGAGEIHYTSNLRPVRGGSTYTAYPEVLLSSPLTSTSWDGDSYSSNPSGTPIKIDLSTVFGVPANVKGIKVSSAIRDSASATTECYFVLGPDTTTANRPHFRCSGLTNDKFAAASFDVVCDANGDVYYTVVASGTNTMDVYLAIWGYYF
jgi:hypothetical protein